MHITYMIIILYCLVFTSKHTNKLIEVQALPLKILGAYVPDSYIFQNIFYFVECFNFGLVVSFNTEPLGRTYLGSVHFDQQMVIIMTYYQGMSWNLMLFNK